MRHLKLFFYIFPLILFIFSCKNSSQNIDNEIKVEAPEALPLATPSSLQNIVDYYNSNITEAYGPLKFSEKWQKWILDEQDIESAFDSYESYLEEFPYEITVDKKNAFLQIIDPGTGGGTYTVTATLFKKEDGSYILAKTGTASTPEDVETEIYFGQALGEKWKDLTANVLPKINVEHFFKKKKDIAQAHPLISIEYKLPQQGTDILVSPRENYFFKCKEGKFMASSEMDKEEIDAICEAWKHYNPNNLALKWDRKEGIFKLN